MSGPTPNLQFRLENNPELLARLNRHVHTLHQERYPDVFAPYDYGRFLGWYQKVLAQENAYGVVAYLEEEPVGYALIFHKEYSSSPFHAPGYELMLVDQMAVVPEHRRKGIGKALIQFLSVFCREKGVARLQLSVWRINEAARDFYQQMGFEWYMMDLEMKIGPNLETVQ